MCPAIRDEGAFLYSKRIFLKREIMKKPHLESTYKLFINGEWKEASDKATYKSYCPANGEVLAAMGLHQ